MIAIKEATNIKDIAIGRSDLFKVEPSKLHVKPDWNSREADDPENVEHIEALAQSIAAVGIKTPLTVYSEKGKLFVSDGHCRLAAVKIAIGRGAEIRDVPVQLENKHSSEAERVFSQIVRNSGKPLAPLEQAKVYKRLIDLGWSETEIAEKAGRSRTSVVEALQLQAAPRAVTDLVKTGKVSATLAKSTIKAARGDADKAAKVLESAVATAAEKGRSRATAKHIASHDGASMKAEISAAFAGAACGQDGTYTVALPAAVFEATLAALKIKRAA